MSDWWVCMYGLDGAVVPVDDLINDITAFYETVGDKVPHFIEQIVRFVMLSDAEQIKTIVEEPDFMIFVTRFGPTLEETLRYVSHNLFDEQGVIYPWFHGWRRRDELHEELLAKGNGYFAVTYSIAFVVSCVVDGKVRETELPLLSSGKYMFKNYADLWDTLPPVIRNVLMNNDDSLEWNPLDGKFAAISKEEAEQNGTGNPYFDLSQPEETFLSAIGLQKKKQIDDTEYHPDDIVVAADSKFTQEAFEEQQAFLLGQGERRCEGGRTQTRYDSSMIIPIVKPYLNNIGISNVPLERLESPILTNEYWVENSESPIDFIYSEMVSFLERDLRPVPFFLRQIVDYVIAYNDDEKVQNVTKEQFVDFLTRFGGTYNLAYALRATEGSSPKLHRDGILYPWYHGARPYDEIDEELLEQKAGTFAVIHSKFFPTGLELKFVKNEKVYQIPLKLQKNCNYYKGGCRPNKLYVLILEWLEKYGEEFEPRERGFAQPVEKSKPAEEKIDEDDEKGIMERKQNRYKKEEKQNEEEPEPLVWTPFVSKFRTLSEARVETDDINLTGNGLRIKYDQKIVQREEQNTRVFQAASLRAATNPYDFKKREELFAPKKDDDEAPKTLIEQLNSNQKNADAYSTRTGRDAYAVQPRRMPYAFREGPYSTRHQRRGDVKE